ncbi:MAG: TetR/AcrR family transcriptional regulator [Chloroflexota bacterium]|nr:TetR/AcrR family transcriptional regulator [Chloroflexota bacterium]
MYDQPTSSSRKPRTSTESNRAQLIAAGYKVLGEKGLDAATVKEIARLAGVSPGLFHYYFASKDELLLAVLWEAGQRFNRQLAQDLQAALVTQSFPVVALLTAHEVGNKDPAWYRLRYELYALGLRNPQLLPGVGEYLDTTRRSIAQTIQTLTGMAEAQAQAVAAVMLACVDGLALQKLAQPSLDLTPSYGIVQSLLTVPQESPG